MNLLSTHYNKNWMNLPIFIIINFFFRIQIKYTHYLKENAEDQYDFYEGNEEEPYSII